MSEKPVFYDAKGRRSKQAVRWSATLGIVLAALVTVSVVSVFFLLPFVPGLGGGNAPVFLRQSHPPLLGARTDERRQTGFILAQVRKRLNQVTSNGKKEVLPKAPKEGPVVAAFLDPGVREGVDSFKKNAPKLTHLMPAWLHLTPDGNGLDLRDFDAVNTPQTPEIMHLAETNGVRVYPLLNNFTGGDNGVFDSKRVGALLSSVKAQDQLVAHIIEFLHKNRLEGLNLDFENLADADYDKLAEFVKHLSVALRSAKLGFTADIEMSRLGFGARIAPFTDFVVLMNYDEHVEGGPPGPVSSLNWFSDNLVTALNQIPADKLVVGMANYGYDWCTTHPERSQTISYQTAVDYAREARDDLPPEQRISFDAEVSNSHFSYEDEDGKHAVWLVDGPSLYNEWKSAAGAGVRGAAVWQMGVEDPTIWNFLDINSPSMPAASAALSHVTFPYEINFDGNGEILYVPPGLGSPQPGTRKITTNAEGYVTDARYTQYPTSVLVQRQGKSGKKIALTFDDGPSQEWTAPVLDTLKQLKVPATFFVIGSSAIDHPGLIRREYQEGHEIGSHSFMHPNMGEISDYRSRLELDATQRAIQSIIGRSTILFRPPYNADSSPETVKDIRPVVVASEMGYYTVAESVDPRDWSLEDPTQNGGVRARSAKEIADEIVQGVEKGEGNVVLLHDAGGNRHMTVEALLIAVPRLEREGYKFVLVSDLFKSPLTRDEVMPQLSARDLLLLPFEKALVYAWYGVTTFLTLAFLVAIALGVARILIVTPLAYVANKRERLPQFGPGGEPLVTVIVAAYNEEQVIARTVQSVLGSLYPHLEVIVVDDGSKDKTLQVVRETFEGNKRVTVLTQENGGKASALNTGMAVAKGEIQVYLDADTLLASDAILKLVRHFADPKVGAVAGNVKVGNRINTLTRLQAVEYIASQNLDRRAYAYINSITVVPGAIGAWRKTAVESAGGYTSDTLAEDMDLTWRVRLAGWKIDNESEAIAYTEAPASLKPFFKQRFRWAFGTLQCLFKHKRILGHHGLFGRAILPALWIFQIFMQIIAPFVDFNLLVSVVVLGSAWMSHSFLTRDWQPLPDATQTMAYLGFMYAVFFLVELLGAWYAFKLDKERKSLLWWLFVQRFFYRQIMYIVVWKALWTAVRGARTGWGKFERRGTVHLGAPPVEGREPAGRA